MIGNTIESASTLISAARETLERNRFVEVERLLISGIDRENQLLFEDPYSLVALIVFEGWSDLLRQWSDVQMSFVSLITEHMSDTEAKVWDCYLLLWTPDFMPPGSPPIPRTV